MTKSRSPTVYLFVNKDSASDSLSRSHGKDASAILSHVQSCRNQKNKQLHMFRVEDGMPESPSHLSSPPTPQSPQMLSVPYEPNSPKPIPTLRSETSSSSSASLSLSRTTSNSSASPQPEQKERSEIDELVDYFDNLYMTRENQPGTTSISQDLYRQIISSEDSKNFSGRIPCGSHGYAMLACTAARMAVDIPRRREEFEIKATKYMQPSLQRLRVHLSDPRARTCTDRQILREMLLHCVTNWYLRDYDAAQTHLNAMSYFTGGLDVSHSSDRNLMDIINRCGLYITNAQRAEHSPCRNSAPRRQSAVDRSLSRVV